MNTKLVPAEGVDPELFKSRVQSLEAARSRLVRARAAEQAAKEGVRHAERQLLDVAAIMIPPSG